MRRRFAGLGRRGFRRADQGEQREGGEGDQGHQQEVVLLRPAAEEALELVEVGPAVNRFANDDESLQRPVAAPIRARVAETLL
jgi:hypothetical protein